MLIQGAMAAIILAVILGSRGGFVCALVALVAACLI